MDFRDIPQYMTNKANYHIDVGLKYFNGQIKEFVEQEGLILNPDFQRGHVWNESQQMLFVEHILKGGRQGRDLYFNKPSWHISAKTDYDDFVCVDGLQRITSIMKFMNNELKAFGFYHNEFTGTIREVTTGMSIYINDLQYKKDVLQWYVEMNSGGTPHTIEEINRVKKMIEEI